MKPTHVIAVAGDRRALCGAKDPLPRLLAKWVPEQKRKRLMSLCPLCEELMTDDPD